MAEIVNLRRARKARERADKEEQAAQNRLLFGASRAERDETRKTRDKDARTLDSHRLDGPSAGEDATEDGA